MFFSLCLLSATYLTSKIALQSSHTLLNTEHSHSNSRGPEGLFEITVFCDKRT